MYLGIVIYIEKTKGADHISGYCTILFSIETAKGFLMECLKYSICVVYTFQNMIRINI